MDQVLHDCFTSEEELWPEVLVGTFRDANLRVLCEEYNMENTFSLMKLSQEFFDQVRGVEQLKAVRKVQCFL